MYELVCVRLADRAQPVMVAPDTPWLKQAIADGVLVMLDQPREPDQPHKTVGVPDGHRA
jgi:hypothetical protein